MKKFKLILLTLALIIPSLAKAVNYIDLSEENFPDENFISFLKTYYSTSLSSDKSQIDTDKITELKLSVGSGDKILDLTGIKNFTKLITLTLPAKPKFTTLDISGMTSLKTLTNASKDYSGSWDDSQYTNNSSSYKGGLLQSVNASGCTSLDEIRVQYWESLTELDISGVSSITKLHVNGTGLTSLDISNNTFGNINSGGTLTIERCPNLLSLKIGYQPYISQFNVRKNVIRHLDMSGITAEHNSLTMSINVSNNKLKDLILPENTRVTAFIFDRNELTFIYPLNGGDRNGVIYKGQNYKNLGTYSSGKSGYSNNHTRNVGANVERVKLYPKDAVSYPNSAPTSITGGQIVLDENDGWYYFVFSSNAKNGTYTFNFGAKSETGIMKVTLERKDDPYPDPEERTPENFYLVRVADSPLYLAGNENYETAFKKSTDVQQFTFDKTTDDGDEYSLSNLLLNGYYRIANNSNLDEATINFGGTEVEDYKHPLLLVGKTYNLTLGSENNLSTHHDANNDKKADLNITGAKFVYRGEGATDAAAIADEVTPSTFTITEGKATGLENVVVEEAADAAEYYTIQGVKADATNLAPGLYIVRQGSKTSKVIIR